MQSPRYISILPWLSTGMSTSNGLIWANWMQLSRVDGGGIESCFGGWFYLSYQLLSNSSEFLRSAIGLVIVFHLAGPFTPQKLSLSEMRTYNVLFQVI